MSYITRNILSITKRVKLLKKKDFIIVVFDLKYKAFIVYIDIFSFNLLKKKLIFQKKLRLFI